MQRGSQRNIEAVVGVLLAAGSGSRFDATGARNKLLAPLGDGDYVVTAVARKLVSVLPHVVAVVREGDADTAARLRALGCVVCVCHDAASGMAASLVCGLRAAADAQGWLIALGDMPYVQAATFRSLSEAVTEGADIAVPKYQQRRGNPVAFSRLHADALLALRGDQGARQLLKTFPVTEIEVDDPGILQDIDTAEDLSIRACP
jgi:molybdenum cofactor cytidylyltransferase